MVRDLGIVGRLRSDVMYTARSLEHARRCYQEGDVGKALS